VSEAFGLPVIRLAGDRPLAWRLLRLEPEELLNSGWIGWGGELEVAGSIKGTPRP